MKSSIRRGIRHFIYATPVHRWMGLGAAQLGGGDWDRQLAGPLKSYLGGTISVEARNMAVLTLLRIRHPSMVGSHPPHGRIQMAKKVTSYLSVLFCPLRHQTPIGRRDHRPGKWIRALARVDEAGGQTVAIGKGGAHVVVQSRGAWSYRGTGISFLTPPMTTLVSIPKTPGSSDRTECRNML